MKGNFVVYDSYIAKQLLKKGYQIVDIAINFNDNSKLVFYFKNEGKIKKDLRELLEKYKKDKTNLTDSNTNKTGRKSFIKFCEKLHCRISN